MTERTFTLDEVKRVVQDAVMKTIDIASHYHERALRSMTDVIRHVVYEDFCSHFRNLTGLSLQAEEANRQEETQHD